MTADEFRRGVAALLKRYEARAAFLREVQAGHARYRRVRVKSYRVPGYTVSAHERLLPIRRSK